MRILIFFLLILFFTSCDHPKKSYIEELTWPKRTVKLDNDLGVLTIRLPEEFDTSFKWLHVSDCACCGAKRYRIQNANFPVLQDKNYITTEVADSIYSFTISHSTEKKCNENIKWEEFKLESFWKNQKDKTYEEYKDTVFEISKIERIDEMSVAILAYKNRSLEIKNGNNLPLQTLNSWVIVKDDLVLLEFNCAAHNCDSFITKMYKALKTLEIKPN